MGWIVMLDIGCIVMDWIHLALDKDVYLAVVMRVKNPAFHEMWGIS